MKKIFFTLICIAGFFTFVSCMSARVDFPRKSELFCIELDTSKSQDIHLKFYGKLNEDVLEVTYVYWFDNWANGWTEARFVASGALKFNPEEKKLKEYEVVTPLKLEYPELAKIRFKDTYIEGEDGITALNNRISRIESINEVIVKKYPDLDYDDFEDKAGIYLFPEKYTKSKYEDEVEAVGYHKEGEKQLGDGTYWRLDYTKENFPEYMWETRLTGTLYRDWEEGYDLIYILYKWNELFGEEYNG